MRNYFILNIPTWGFFWFGVACDGLALIILGFRAKALNIILSAVAGLLSMAESAERFLLITPILGPLAKVTFIGNSMYNV